MKTQKIVQIITIGLFCVCLSVPLLTFLIAPEKDFSTLENRYLTKFPTISISSFLDQSFQKKSEEAFQDQFIARDSFVGLNTYQDYVLGKSEIHDVYLGKDGYLLTQSRSIDESIWRKNIESINTFVQQTSLQTYLMLVPSTRTILDTKLPEVHYDINEDEISQDISHTLSPQVNYIDIFQTLRHHKNEDIFYKSDHHWSALGSYYGYEAFQTIRQNKPIPLEKKQVIKDDFKGSLSARSRAFWYPEEKLAIYYTPPIVKVSYDGVESNKLYIEENAKRRDAYTYFMDGNHAEVNIHTQSKNKQHLLILRDSYAQSFAPYLANDISDISLLDLRYYKGSVSDYIQENKVDEVLFLYSMDTLLTTRDITSLK